MEILANPWHISLFLALQNLSPRWEKWDDDALDSIDQAAFTRLIGVGLAEVRIGTEVRQQGSCTLLQAILLATGHNPNELIGGTLMALARGHVPEWNETGRCENQCTILLWPMQIRLSAGGAAICQEEPRDTALVLTVQKIADTDSVLKPPNVEIENFNVWAPSDLQREIWNALEGRGMTADELEGNLSVARATLFKKPGAVPEMIEYGLVRNDRAHGGYYRPDAPP